jgi:hypothetical protein
VFDLIPSDCNKHISTIYAQLGHPQINFDSFWDVYNQLRDAVDAEYLFHSSTGVFPEDHTDIAEDDPNNAELPLSHLCSCQFGEDGVPAERIIEEGEVIVVSHLPLLLIHFLSEVPESHAALRGAGEGSGMAPFDITYPSAHISLDDDLVVDFTDDEADEIF